MKKPKFLILILLLIATNEVYSCSCLRTSIKDGFKNSDIIFSGKVVDLKVHQITDTTTYQKNGKTKFYVVKYREIEFKFEVSKLIKGKLDSNFVAIKTTGGDSDCGNYFKLGSEHLVYSYKSDLSLDFNQTKKVIPYLTTNLCTRTKELKKVNIREIKKLERLAKRNQK